MVNGTSAPHTHVLFRVCSGNHKPLYVFGVWGLTQQKGLTRLLDEQAGSGAGAAAAKAQVDAGGLSLKRGLRRTYPASWATQIRSASGCHHLWRITESLSRLPSKFPPNSFLVNSNLHVGAFWEM